MVYEVFMQLRGNGGKVQVDDAEIGLIQNVGASGGTVVVQVYGR
jgi:acetyl-CoA C-acetyltransferase